MSGVQFPLKAMEIFMIIYITRGSKSEKTNNLNSVFKIIHYISRDMVINESVWSIQKYF